MSSMSQRGLSWRSRSLPAALAVLTALLISALPPFTGPAAAADSLISQGKTATASSTAGGNTAANAVDGNLSTRWESLSTDLQWLQVDLGATASISQVVLNWEGAYGKNFKIETSATGAANSWTAVTGGTVVNGTGGVQTLNVTGSGQYVRMNGTLRGTGWGYSLFEFKVIGSFGVPPATCGTTNVALSKTPLASSTQGTNTAANAFDGNLSSRWESLSTDLQWLQVDLGTSQSICKVVLNWEGAYGKTFTIETSATGAANSWTATTGGTVTNGTGGVQPLTVSGTGRYVRMNGTLRGTGYGYSLFEFAVYTAGGTPPPAVCPTYSDVPNLGANVAIFDPTMPIATIQAKLDSVFTAQESNQFGPRRDALLFKPGTYNGVQANIGFYTHIGGLGLNPDDVQINGDVTVDAGWFNGNATQNFWRSAENFAVTPSQGTNRWAVSQAAPLRRVHVKGGLNLFPSSYGWSSGGYLADSKVDGVVASASQQQWYSRDSTIGSWNGSNWNMVFSGVTGAPATTFPAPAITSLPTTPVSREKPFLYVDGAGKYRVFLPALRTNASGASWVNGTAPGTSVSMSTFFVAKPADTTLTINAALDSGCNVFFTPGIYHLSEALRVSKANTVILGIGMPTLIPDNAVNGMNVADVDGVRVAGILFDAGTGDSEALLTIGGTVGSTVSHAGNPTTVQDVYFRIGGGDAIGRAKQSLVVNSNDTIIDHIWAWRADHGAAGTVGWTINTADTGLTVNGNNVLATGLFVEHYQKYEVMWNGQNGKTIFFQNEIPYDVPSAAAWMNNGKVGYAAYKVAANVTTHEAWGLGVYCNFTSDTTIAAANGFEVPVASGVKFHNMLTVSLGGMGSIANIINNTGGPAQGTATVPVTMVSYP